MSSKQWRRRGNGGFTIIELLVVVIVIGILASAGIAKYQSFSDMARKRTCTMNQSGIETAIAVWVTQNSDFNQNTQGFGRFAIRHAGWYHGGWNNGGPFNNSWAISSVVRDNKMFICPSALRAGPPQWTAAGAQGIDGVVERLPWDWGGYGCYGAQNNMTHYHLYWGGPNQSTWSGSGGHWYDPSQSPQAHTVVWCSANGGYACGGPDGTRTTEHTAKW